MEYEKRFGPAVDSVFRNQRTGIPTMVISPTATGKTTTIPVMIHSRLGPGSRVVVCIPTRIAVISIAEKAQKLYPSVKIESRYGSYSPPSEADIVYTTPTQLLLEYVRSLDYGKQGDSFPWDAVIIDEVHMRTLIMSLILSFHRVLTDVRRKNAKGVVTVLMTATPSIDLGPFDYAAFPVSAVPGSTAKTVFLEQAVEQDKINEKAAEVTLSLLKGKDPFSILVFVKGIVAAQQVERLILEAEPADVEIFLLNGKAPLSVFNQIMKPITIRKRVVIKRVVISTNVAESSITIPHVAHVVDTLLERRPSVADPFATNSLEDYRITHTSSTQRKGRIARNTEVKGVAFYHPLMTEEEYKTFYESGIYEEARVRVPDIQLTSPLKIITFLIDHLFSPREVLLEIETLNDHFYELVQRHVISVSYRVDGSTVEGDVRDLMEAYVEQFNIEQSESNSYSSSASSESEVSEASIVEQMEEHMALTDRGHFWIQNHWLEYMPMLFVYKWCFVKKYDPIVGCLIATIMNEEHEGIFAGSDRYDSNVRVIIEMQKQVYARYLGVDPLSTLLYLFYDLFRFLPLVATLSFEAVNIRSWCTLHRIGFDPVFNILLKWKMLCGTVAQKSSRSMLNYMDIAEAIKKTINCCDSIQALSLSGGMEYTDLDYRKVQIRYGGVPYLDDVSDKRRFPQKVHFLKLRSTRLLNGDATRSFNFFVLGDYRSISYRNPLSSLQITSVSHVNIDDGDRYHRVEPYEIGLISGMFAMPDWIFDKRTERKSTSVAEDLADVDVSNDKPTEIKTLILPSVIYPPFFNQDKNIRRVKIKAYEPEIEYVLGESAPTDQYFSSAVELDMLLGLWAYNEEIDDRVRVPGHNYPLIF